MKSELTPGQIESYQQDGVVVVEGLLDAEELQTWRTYVDEAVANRQDRKLANGDMKSGYSSFHNALLPHGAGENITPGRRRAMTCPYMPDGEIFNGQKNVLPDAYIKELNVGDLLENDEFNPLIYHKTKTAVSA